MRRILAAVMALAMLVGCSAPKTGIVYDKKYEEAYQWIDSQCTYYNSKGICTIRVPVVHYYPEHWLLCLRNGDDSGCRYVDQVDWHRYKVGDQYP